MCVRTSSGTPPPLHTEQAAAPELRFPEKHSQERPLCSGHEDTLRSRDGNAHGQILITYSTFSDYPAVFLHRKPAM